MSEKNYIERLRVVEKNLEEMLAFEQKALDKWGKPKNQEQADRQRVYTEPIIRTITAYEQALAYIRNYFPELKKEK